MPTGYTGKLHEGEPQTFEEFALSCARAFGALITMRDDPSDAPIPEKFEPDSYYLEALDRNRTELRTVSSLSEAACEARAQTEYEDDIAARAKRLGEMAVIRERYEAMLARVRAWTPPTSEHHEMKSFMVQQLEESIKWDCGTDYYERNEPKRKTGVQWREDKIASLTQAIGRNSEEHAKEHARAVQRTRWVNDLRRSLR
jgi:hypothetical protein